MEVDDNYFRLSGSYGKPTDRQHSFNSKNNSSIVLSKRHRRKNSNLSISNRSYLVARKNNKNSYQLTYAQKLEIINQQAMTQSNSRYRKFCYKIRYNLIMFPMS